MGKKGMEMLWGLPVPFWEAVFRWSTIAAFVLGGLAATCAFVSAWVGYELSDLTQKAANIQILEARARSDEAKAEAAKANEGTAAANERAAQLELALEKERAARLPRALSQEQRRSLISFLTSAPKGRVIVKPNFVDMEATQYANQITAALTDAGFIGVGDAPLDIISLGEPGIFIAVRDATKIPPHAAPIITAFQIAKIETRNATANWVPDENTVVIIVSRKP